MSHGSIAEYLGLSGTQHVGKAALSQEGDGVIKKVEERPAKVDFDTESIAEIKEKNRRRQRAEDLMEEI